MSDGLLARDDGRLASRPLVRRGDDGPARVLRMDPRDGATGVLCDTTIVACLSHPADPASVTPSSLSVSAAGAVVPGSLRLDAAGVVLMWESARPLAPGVTHRAEVRGLRDRDGRAFATHSSRFVPCALSRDDLAGR